MKKFVLGVTTLALVGILLLVLDDRRAIASPHSAPQSSIPIFAWAKTWGGSSDDWGRGVVRSGTNVLYLAGGFSGTNVNFNPSGGTETVVQTRSYQVLVDGSADPNLFCVFVVHPALENKWKNKRAKP
jgi:hypothetical protein